MEIKSNLTVTRGEGERREIWEERRGRGKPRNMNRGLMGADNWGGGTDFGNRGG